MAKHLKNNKHFSVAAIIEPEDSRAQEIADVGLKWLLSISV